VNGGFVESEIPYMPSVTNLHKILDAIQRAAAPDAFGLDFLKDLGFTSSNDRPAIKLLKFLGLLDSGGKPTSAYKEFMDQNKAKSVLGVRLRKAYDDLFTSDKEAQTRQVDSLKGWFKTKTGVGDAVAKKMATTFKSLASYANFDNVPSGAEGEKSESNTHTSPPNANLEGRQGSGSEIKAAVGASVPGGIGFTYRIEIHLPDTTNLETYRSIFRAIREELQS
jgi:hypothetical protein